MAERSTDHDPRDFFRALYPRLYGFVFLRTDALGDDVEEIVQEALLDAWRARPSFSGGSSLETWIFSIARHKVADYWRRRNRSPEIHTPLVRDALERIESDLIPEALIDQVETRRQVAATLERLPAPYAQVLEMRYLEGISVPDIAGRLKETPSAVESRLTRARESFRQVLSSLEVIRGEIRA